MGPQDGLDYEAILDEVPAIVFVAETGPDGRWLYVNGWIEPILGYTRDEWLRFTAATRPVHPDDSARVIAEEQRIEQSAPDEAFLGEYRMLHRDGHAVWLRDTGKLFTTGDGADGEVWGIRWGSIRQRRELSPKKQMWRQSALPWISDLDALPGSLTD